MNKKELVAMLKEKFNTKLEKRVIRNILKNVNYCSGETYQEKMNQVLNDYSHGCETGAVSEMISYKDTVNFFNRYKKEILEQLQNDIDDGLFNIKEYENDFEYYPVAMLGKNMIKLNYKNMVNQKRFDEQLKNDLAWYAFDQVVYRVMCIVEEL